MLGKSRRVKESAAMTKSEMAIVPIHPDFFSRQMKTAKTIVNIPNATV
jgi:hypothetical protein